jgi:CRISPR-associated protein Cmr3
MTPEQARAIEVRGPWWAEVDLAGKHKQWLLPAPTDAVWHKPKPDELLVRTRLAPLQFGDGVMSDLPDGLLPLRPLAALGEGKASAGHAMWGWDAMEAWLTRPVAQDSPPSGFGVALPEHESRTHVAIAGDSQTAEDGKLFTVDAVRGVGLRGNEVVRLSWAFSCADKNLKPGLVPLGGERRVSRLSPAGVELPDMPTLSVKDGKLRVVLVTPGIFAEGFKPGTGGLGAGVDVFAAAVGRPLAISGWDFDKKQPKASRRMAPAGSVYWLQFASNEAALQWAAAHWWRPISDDAQDRLDGFGVCVVGVA